MGKGELVRDDLKCGSGRAFRVPGLALVRGTVQCSDDRPRTTGTWQVLGI